MNLRGNNFVSQIFDISVVKTTIEGLLGGDRYYFNVNVNNKSNVFYVDVEEFEDGEVFSLYKDYTKYNTVNPFESGYTAVDDKLIKVIHNRGITVGEPKITSYSETPAKDMAGYVLVYIDAMQTV